jgi:hypothetical protein
LNIISDFSCQPALGVALKKFEEHISSSTLDEPPDSIELPVKLLCSKSLHGQSVKRNFQVGDTIALSSWEPSCADVDLK